MSEMVHEVIITIGGREYELDVWGDYQSYIPAKTLGPPENCYPSEGGYFQITRIRWSGAAPSDPQGELDLPTKILADLEETIYEEIAGGEE